jgi:hypothetical protein
MLVRFLHRGGELFDAVGGFSSLIIVSTASARLPGCVPGGAAAFSAAIHEGEDVAMWYIRGSGEDERLPARHHRLDRINARTDVRIRDRAGHQKWERSAVAR